MAGEGACVIPEGAVPPGIVYPDSEETRGRTPGASCQALRQAVAGLSRLDDFTMESIGRGFFSEVYRVVHKTTGQVMVLKMNLRPSNRPNMLKEVQLMNKLSHPNILKFVGVCVHEGQLHALTEFINGGSLEQLVQSEEPLSWQVRARLGLDIAEGMHYLHRRQVFHRDLTSKNVLIRRGDSGALSAVVGDFGLAAKIPHPLLPSRLSTVGSFWWMAPECITNRPYNQRADVFSFGVILLELIGRVSADPDVLLRTPSFGVDYLAFVALCPPDCNLEMLLLAFSCCVHSAVSRPPFSELVGRLESLLSSLRADVLRPVSPTPRTTLHHTADDYKHHRRSLSDDIQLVMTDTCSPSEKARVHRRHSHCRETRPRGALRCPRDVAEFMAARDPAYRPGDTANPFNALKHYRDGRKVLEYRTELFSSCFEVHSPRGGRPAAPEHETPPRATCLSLPASPVSRRRAAQPPPADPPDGAAGGERLSEAANALRRLGSCESGFFSSVGDAERASASDLSPASLRSDYSHESLSRGGLTAGLAKRSSSVYTDSSDDISSLGCESEARDRRHADRYEKDIRQIVEYFERSSAAGGGGGGARAQRHSLGCRQRALDRLSVEWARQRLERAERAQVPPRLVADCLRVFSRRPEVASRPAAKPKVPISEGTVRDKLTVFESRG